MKRREFLIQSVLATAGALGGARTSNAQDNDMTKMPDYSLTGAKLISGSTPVADGFHYPAEWEKHEFTIMVMPPPQNWKGYGLPLRDVRGQWADVANKLSEYEPVLMVVDPSEKRYATRLLNKEIERIEFPVNDGWSRDSGPMFVVNGQGERRVAGFTFNGWGAKFPPYADDALLKARLCKHLDVPMYAIDLCLEGGAVAVDGAGTVITTEQCLLNSNRNATPNRANIQNVLNESLGTRKVIWLGKGLEPDPVTDGHVDGLAAFAEPGAVLLHTTDDRSDRNYRICQDAKKRLQQATDAQGHRLEVIEVPLDGDVSYMNFYIANGCILVPITKDQRQDARPMGVLREVFDDYDVIGIDSTVLGEGGGGIHCITQQVPSIKTV